MKALTVQQPWSWAIFHGKNVENRTQAWKYRGPLAIHAGARWSDRGARSELVKAAWYLRGGTLHSVPGDPDAGTFLLPHWATYGAVIGVVDLVDVHPETGGCCEPWGERAYVEHGGKTRRAITHLVLENARAIPEPVDARGALGLWNMPDDVARAVRDQM